MPKQGRFTVSLYQSTIETRCEAHTPVRVPLLLCVRITQPSAAAGVGGVLGYGGRTGPRRLLWRLVVHRNACHGKWAWLVRGLRLWVFGFFCFFLPALVVMWRSWAGPIRMRLFWQVLFWRLGFCLTDCGTTLDLPTWPRSPGSIQEHSKIKTHYPLRTLERRRIGPGACLRPV